MRRSRGKTTSDDASKDQRFVTLATLSHVGRKRSSNQDSFCALVGPDAPSGTDALLAVADGMGGHAAGEVASEMAIRGLIARLSRDNHTCGARDGPVSRLKRVFRELNTEIHTAAALPETRGMGTTLTAVVITGNTLVIGHVGDSRAYLLRGGRIEQLTQDHNWVAEQVAEGLINHKDTAFHWGSNMLTRAMGVAPSIRVDSIAARLKKGDLILVCSDGVHSLIKDDELVNILNRNDPQSSSEEIVSLANARGGNDNVTVVVARIDNLSQFPKEAS